MQNECLFEKSHQFDLQEHQALNIYWGQENRLERAYDRAFDRLRALRKERLNAQTDPRRQPSCSASVSAAPLPEEPAA
jgi:hypothetical protein